MHTTGIHKRWIISVVIVTSWLASADAITEFGLYEHNETHSLVHTKSTELGHHADVYVPNEAAGYLSLPVQSKSDLHPDEEDVAQENPVQENTPSTGSVQSPVIQSPEGNAGSENYMAQTGEDKASPEAFSSQVDDTSSSAVDGKRVAPLDVEASSTEQDGQSSAEAQALETQASGGSTMSDSVTSEVSKHDVISPTVSAIGMISNEDPDSVLATTDDMSFTKASQDSPEQTKEGLPASIDEDSPASNKEDPSVVTKEESFETANRDTLSSGEVNSPEDIEEDPQAAVKIGSSVDTSGENDATVPGEKTDVAATRAPDTKLENPQLKTDGQVKIGDQTGEVQSDEQHEQPDDEQTDDDTQDDATDDEPQDDDTEDDYTEDDGTKNGDTKDSTEDNHTEDDNTNDAESADGDTKDNTEDDVKKDDHTKDDSTKDNDAQVDGTKVDDTNDDDDDDKRDTDTNTDDEPKNDASIASSSSEEEDADDAEDAETSAAGPGWRPPPVVKGTVLESTDGSSWDATDRARQQGVTTFAMVMCAAVGATFVVLVAVWINRMRHQQRLQNLEDPDDEEFTVFSASDTRYIANSRGEYAPLR